MIPVVVYKQTRLGKLERKDCSSFVKAWERMESLQKNSVYWVAIVWDRPHGSQDGQVNSTRH